MSGQKDQHDQEVQSRTHHIAEQDHKMLVLEANMLQDNPRFQGIDTHGTAEELVKHLWLTLSKCQLSR